MSDKDSNEKILLRNKRLRALIRTAQYELKQENYASAKAHLDQALDLAPDSDDAVQLKDQVIRHSHGLFELGEDAYLDERYDEAERHLKDHLKLSPTPYPRADEYLKIIERIQREREGTISVLMVQPTPRPGDAEGVERERPGETVPKPHPPEAEPAPGVFPPGRAVSSLTTLIRRLKGSARPPGKDAETEPVRHRIVTCPHCGLENRISRSSPAEEQTCERCGEALKRPFPISLRDLLFALGMCCVLWLAGAFASQILLQDVTLGIVLATILGVPAGAAFCLGSQDRFRMALLIGAAGCAAGSALGVYFGGSLSPSLLNLITGGMIGTFIGAVAGYSPSLVLALFFCAAGLVVGETVGGAFNHAELGAVVGALLGVGAVTDITPSKLPIPHMILCAATIALGKVLGQMVGDALGSPTAGGIVGTFAGVVPVFVFFPFRRFWWYAALSVVGGAIAWLITQDATWTIFAVLGAGIVALLL
ncbi:MAG: tetratricopeptide repeat protein [Thermodesulfobacteriota bacterium]